MNKKTLLAMTLSALLVLSVNASADARPNKDRDDDYRSQRQHERHQQDQRGNEPQRHDNGVKRGMPFQWQEHVSTHQQHHYMNRIDDHEWNNRFPGLRSYRWSGQEGFWHNGRYVQDAVLFYDQSDCLTSFGYMNNGVFILVNQDNDGHQDNDSFFFAWFNR